MPTRRTAVGAFAGDAVTRFVRLTATPLGTVLAKFVEFTNCQVDGDVFYMRFMINTVMCRQWSTMHLETYRSIDGTVLTLRTILSGISDCTARRILVGHFIADQIVFTDLTVTGAIWAKLLIWATYTCTKNTLICVH